MAGTRRGPVWLLPVLAAVLVLTATAGLVARVYYPRDVAATQPPAILPSNSPLPPSAQPGPRDVRATPDAVAHPMFDTVRELLQAYFDSINGRSYARWKATVTSGRIRDMPEQQWRTAYRSTQDGSVVVYRIESGTSSTAKVMLAFTSTQDPADAPLELPESCIRWNVIFPLAVEGGEWKLDGGPTGASPQHEKCA